MTQSSIELRVRRSLPLLRLAQICVPIPVARWSEKRAAAHVRVPAGFRHEVVCADGVRCEWFIPQSSPMQQVLLYLHGGGFVFGLSSIHRAMVTQIACQMGCRVLMVDYRLAPDFPFPAALDDCVAVYRWLLKQGIRAHNVVVAGDSAGGNLTITTLMKLRDCGDPLPAAAACLSPVADFSRQAEQPSTFRDPVLHPKAVKYYNAAYVAESDGDNPLISPVYGNWRGLPPLLIHAGEDEILCADAVRIEALARAGGVDVQLAIYPRMWHVWQLNPQLPQSTQSLQEIAQFLKSHLHVAAAQIHTGT